MFTFAQSSGGVADALAIQVVNYRTKPHLISCLQTVIQNLQGSKINFELLVLDNASGDDLSDLESLIDHQVTVVNSKSNLGFGAGHNRLAELSSSEYLAILNPDIELRSEQTFETLISECRDSGVAACGPKLVDEAGNDQRWDHGELYGLRATVANRAGHAYWRTRSEVSNVAWVCGAFMVFRREAFKQVAGFDERFFLYKEEEDLCLRLRQQGWQIRYCPQVAAFHEGSVVAGRGAELEKSVQIFKAKHFATRSSRVYELLHQKLFQRLG